MKYTTFRNSLLAGGILAIVGGSFYCSKHSASSNPPPVSSPSTTESKPTPLTTNDIKPVVAQPRGTTTAAADPPVARGLVAAPQAVLADSGSKAPRIKTPLRELDRELMKVSAQPQSQGGDKVKDVFPSRPYKVNLYVEGTRVVRAKVDLNRNGKWDEKWSFEAGPGSDGPVIKRQVSPGDDDTNYTLNYKLAGDSWVQK